MTAATESTPMVEIPLARAQQMRDEIAALRSLVRAVYRDSWMEEEGVQVLACGGLTKLTDEQHAVLYRSLNEPYENSSHCPQCHGEGVIGICSAHQSRDDGCETCDRPITCTACGGSGSEATR